MAVRYHSLDGLRGISALSVVLFHCNNMFHTGPIFMHGYLAVDVFFILSGFVIPLNYEVRLNGRMRVTQFLLRRGRKLLPIYWIGFFACATSAAIYAQWTDALSIEFAVGLFLLPQLASGVIAYPINGPTWSLFAEWIVNTIYASKLFYLKTRWILTAAAICWGIIIVITFHSASGLDVGEYSPDLFVFGLPRAIAGFSTGLIIYRTRKRLITSLPVITPGILFCMWMIMAEVPTYGPTPIFDIFVAIFGAPLLIALLIRSESLAPQWCDFAGRLSYPLYVSHIAVIRLWQHYMPRPDLLFAILAVFSAIVVAWIIAAMNDHIQAWLPRPKAIAAVPETPRPAE